MPGTKLSHNGFSKLGFAVAKRNPVSSGGEERSLPALTGRTRQFERCSNSRAQPVVGQALSDQSTCRRVGQACPISSWDRLHRTSRDWLDKSVRPVGSCFGRTVPVRPPVEHGYDLAIFSKNPKSFKQEVWSPFQIKDLGESNLLLGMNVIQQLESVTLTQSHYIDVQLERFNCSHLHPALTPMKPKAQLVKATNEEKIKHINSGNNYHALIGALNYLSVTTRPDITFAVSSLAQYLNEPGSTHWDAGIQALRYLKGTKDIGLTLSKTLTTDVKLIGYTGANWALCPESRRSVLGNLILLNGNVIGGFNFIPESFQVTGNRNSNSAPK
ncbi:hypothetical protein PCASD_26775 [Puccinia coronata f. sp. avenae]|uniref:Reverse transcriptase Ty1/copia-type domain-containing protein n=1 Tax=Puccinia coronata f. sp. avenae TaxID=200324 RepID=A0A2N5RYT8_9BASI|nr:hypothetical protein PCASD_26775 [Puccinia coronata f. sp. avenae]